MAFDERKAQRVIRFIEALKHTKGEFHGKPFELLPWQEKIIRDVFGTVRDDDPTQRQYTSAYIEIPKKNGKSELGAAIALNMLVNDDEWKAEVYSCASDRQQAAIVFDVAVDMVKQSPALMKRIKIVPSMKRMVYQPTGSIYQVLSSEVATKHGLNVSACIFDELHTQPTRALYDVMTQGSGDARKQPLWFFLTTAGTDRNSICWEVHQKAVDILEGRKDDPRFYPVLFGLPDEADWTNEQNWYRANPSLDYTMQGFSFLPAAAAVAGNAVSALSAALNSSTLRPVGVSAMQGLRNGILAGRSGVISAMRSAARAAVNAAKAELEIHSPSRVFENEVGVMTMRGFGEGVVKESKAQARIIRNAARYLTGEAREGSIVTTSNDNRRSYDNSVTSTIQVQQMVVRDEQDIRSLAVEIATLTRRQQRGKGMRMA